MNYSSAVDSLREHIVKCVFKTRDGRDREMWATRNFQLISRLSGSDFDISGGETVELEKKYNHVNVFDLQKNEFRKINLNTLQSWEEYSLTVKVPSLEENPTAFKKPRELNIQFPEDMDSLENFTSNMVEEDKPKTDVDEILDVEELF